MKKEFIITKAIPQGFCFGVVNAIKKTKETISNKETIKPIYILGSIVHNKKINEAFESLGLKIIKLEEIDNINKGTIIITAHGASPSIYKKILDKGLDIIDTTCEKVKFLHKKALENIKNNKNVYFLGIPSHEETKGVLGISDKINLIDMDNIDYNIKLKDNSILLFQTTLPYSKAIDIYNKLKENNPTLVLEQEICDASLTRQKAAIRIAATNDLVLVIGDKTSNNCASLLKSIKEINDNCYIVEEVGDLKNIDFSNVNKIAITSAASTPKVIVDEVIETLNNLDGNDFVSKINTIDYLNI